MPAHLVVSHPISELVRAHLLSLVHRDWDATVSNMQLNNVDGCALSAAERYVLSHNLSFIPTPQRTRRWEFSAALDSALRDLRLKVHFAGRPVDAAKEAQYQDLRRFYIKGNWAPPDKSLPPGAAADIADARDGLLREFTRVSSSRFPVRCNLAPFARRVLASLAENSGRLTITPADKNLGVCVCSTEFYYTHMREHAHDSATYSPPFTIQQFRKFGGPLHRAQQDLSRLMDLAVATCAQRSLPNPFSNEYYKWITNRLVADVTQDVAKFQVPAIYLLFKVHKTPVSTRAITPTFGWITTTVGNMIDYWLQPIYQRLPSYVRDSRDLLAR